MNVVTAILVLLVGVVILIISSERAVDQLLKISTILGASPFVMGFVVASLGSDLPEIVNSVISAFLGHGDISVGDSFGSVLTQITLVLGLIPFFCNFCRLIPIKFVYVGMSEVAVLAVSIFLAKDGAVTRLDGVLLVALWAASMLVLRKFGDEPIAAEESTALEEPTEPMRRIVTIMVAGFIGIAFGSYMVIESVIVISRSLNISEYVISFFLVSLGTSLPELVVEISAIRKRHFELAIGDIIGSCLVDATLAIGIGPIFFPIEVTGSSVLVTGLYALFASVVVVGVLSYRGVNTKRTGALFILIYLLSFLIPRLL